MVELETRLHRTARIITEEIKKDIADEEKRYGKMDITSMKDYLEEVRWGMTSKEFKEEVYYLATQYDNNLYENGCYTHRLYINMMDDGSIVEEDGTIYSYRQIMAEVRKQAFKNNEEEEE